MTGRPHHRFLRLRLDTLEDRAVPTTLYGLTDNNFLARFDSASPGTISHAAYVSGLKSNERLVGMDFRPRTGQLYGVGVVSGASDTIRVYTINPLTGIAKLIPGSTALTITSGNAYGVDFNPTEDQIRVVNDADENFRINPNDGFRADIPTNDTAINPVASQLREVAYDRNFDTGLAVANRTTAYAIDASTNSLVTLGGINQSPSPNGGAVQNSQPLGLTLALGSTVGFDIPAGSGTGFATFQNFSTGLTGLYSINLGTGAATLVGNVGNGFTTYVGLAASPANTVVTGSGNGVVAKVRVFDGLTGASIFDIAPYGTKFKGGVRVATADVNSDGIPDIITAPGPGSALPVQVFNGIDGTPLAGAIGSFSPFGTSYKSGIQVAAADVNGDGNKDVLVAPDSGMEPRVKVISGADGSELASFLAFDQKFKGGVRLATSDFDRDGRHEIVAATGRGTKARVRVFDGAGAPFASASLPSFVNDFLPAGKATSGLFVAAGDLNGDGVPEIIVGDGANAHVRTFNGLDGTQLADFLAYPKGFLGGVRVAVADFDGDGRYEIRTAGGPGRLTEVRTFDGVSLVQLNVFGPFDKARSGAYIGGVRY